MYRIVLLICGSLIFRVLRIWNRLQNYFGENFDTLKLSHIGDVKDSSISALQEGGGKLSFFRLLTQLQLVDEGTKSARYYWYHVYVPAGNSLIVGMAY